MEKFEDYETVVVTRHSGLVDYLVSKGIIEEDAEVIEHATVEDVQGKHVIGVLPNHLAAEAKAITEVPIHYPEDYRGEELSEEEVREYAGEMETYIVMTAEEARSYDDGVRRCRCVGQNMPPPQLL